MLPVDADAPHMDRVLRIRTGPSASTRSPASRATAPAPRSSARSPRRASCSACSLAYLTEAGEDEFRFHALDGDAAPFGGPSAGDGVPRADTLCDRMLRGGCRPVSPTSPCAGRAGRVWLPRRRAPRRRAGPAPRRHGLRHALLRLRASGAALSDRDTRLLEVFARLIGDQIDARAASAPLAPARGRGDRRPGAARRAEGARALHGRALRGGRGALHGGRGRARPRRRGDRAGRPGRAAGRRRQARRARGDPAEARCAVRRRVADRRAHPAIGERVVASIPSLAHLAPAVRAEHERWDGKGCPDGLAARIPLASRICLASTPGTR